MTTAVLFPTPDPTPTTTSPTPTPATSPAEVPTSKPDDAGAVAAPPLGYEVRLTDGSTEHITGATAYVHEGQMTSFFRTADGDPYIDAWSERLASIRTSEILAVRRPDLVAHDVVAEAERVLQ
jgi:hypothetical protein